MAEMRRCAGSAKFGIEAHEAPVEDFPKQASQKDGLGRMCRVHWNEYTTALRKVALERKAAEGKGHAVTATPDGAELAKVDAPAADGTQPADVTATTDEDGPKVPKRANGRGRGGKAAAVAQEGAAG